LERLAIYINTIVYGGRKAGVDGIDLDFDKDGHRYLVAIKSGPNWANDSQSKKLIDQFNTARKRLRTSGAIANIICVNGCCYGKTRQQSEYKAKGNYYKFAGQKFWELISGVPSLYTDLIVPIGHNAMTHNDEYNILYGSLVNRFTSEFIASFCNDDFTIDWNKLLIFNSEYVPAKQ
jgi:hypothetical protein